MIQAPTVCRPQSVASSGKCLLVKIGYGYDLGHLGEVSETFERQAIMPDAPRCMLHEMPTLLRCFDPCSVVLQALEVSATSR